jgi:hypothetical protein
MFYKLTINFFNNLYVEIFMTTVVLTSQFPAEIGVAALYCSFVKDVKACPMSVPDASNISKIEAEIGDSQTIVMIGTYWNKILDDLITSHPEKTFHVYCFGDIPASTEVRDHALKLGKLKFFSGSNGVGPAQWVWNVVEKDGVNFSKFSQVLVWIDDRLCNRNIKDNQPFFTGLCNYGASTLTIVERFMKIFQGKIAIDDIVEIGDRIVSAQIGIVEERVLKNSKLITLKDGTKACITEGFELVNLTHDSLHAKYPEADVTIVLRMGLNLSGDDNLVYSIRSFNPHVDAGKLAKLVNGDGNKESGGGRVSHKFEIPF